MEKGNNQTTQLLSTLISGLALQHPSSNPPPFEVSSGSGSLNCTFRYPVKPQTEDCLTSSRSSEKPSKMTRRKPTTVNAPDSAHAVQVYSQKSIARCQDWCSCSCHQKNVLRLKEPNLIGSFSLAYGGLPWLTPNCDQKSCRSRSVPSVAVTFQFPPWMWKRYLSSSFTYTPVRGPDINFKLPRIVHWTNKLWGYGITGNVRGVQELYSSGMASPWDVNALGGSLLHYATDHGHWDLCSFLVREGVPTETEDDFKNTPTSIVWEKILANNLTDNEASTMASAFSNTDFLETRQFTILHKIVLRIIPRTLESELEYSTKDLDAVDSRGRTCVSWAAARGDDKVLKTLLKYGADPNIQDGQGSSPLHHASNVACISLLVEFGANIDASNSFGHTPLHLVCRGSGSIVLLKRLIGAGVDINAVDHDNETALLNATYNRHPACALHLLENGADMNIANGPYRTGNAPVHMAIMQNMHPVLDQLLTRGVEYTRLKGDGSTILHEVAQFADVETIGILKQHHLKSLDPSHLNDEAKMARDYLNEREDGEEEDFKSVFEDFLRDIDAVKSTPQHEYHDELEAIHHAPSLGALKDAVIASYTPVDSEDEDSDKEFEGEDLGHNPPIFFDAVEDVAEMLPVVEIAV